MQLTLTRCTEHGGATFGLLCIGTEPLFVTLEPAWQGNAVNESCIPEGSYELHPYSSVKFGECIELRDVPDRQAILIHAGNTVADTHGCILLGKKLDQLDGRAAVCESMTACLQLKNRIVYPAVLHVINGRRLV